MPCPHGYDTSPHAVEYAMKFAALKTPIVLLSAMALTACGSALTPGDTGAKAPQLTNGNTPWANTASSLTVLGRSLALDGANHLRVSWPGVSLGTQFHGTALSVTLRDMNNTYNNQTEDSYWDVSIDGNLTAQPLQLSTANNTYVIAQDLADANHTVWLTKRTEAMLGSSEFSGFSTPADGKFLDAPAAPSRHLEVIGSSVETGYGVGQTQCSGYQGANQDVDAAWPELLGKQLQAAVMDTAYSGKGLINNINPGEDPTNVMPLMYPLADARDFDAKWDFSSWHANAVLIDLGGNDWNGLNGPPDADKFDQAYVQFIKTVQANSPGAPVYVLLNATTFDPARSFLRVQYQNVVRTMADASVKFFEVPVYTGKTLGCDGHPTPALHASMAQTLAAQVQADLGW